MQRSFGFCAALTSALFAGGCDKDDPPLEAFPDGLQAVWGEMFAPYELYPMFPVRTDVQPGDVLVMCRRAPPLEARVAAAVDGQSKPKEEFEWRQLFSLAGIDQSLASQAGTRMVYNNFPNPSASAPLGAASGVNPYARSGAVNRAGFASFPTVLAYTQRRTDLGVGTAVGVAAVGAGASKSAQSTYLLEIPAAEFAAVTHSELQKVLIAAAPNLPAEVKLTLKGVATAFDNGTCILGSLSVVGQVFYTRKISVAVGDSYASAMSARAAYQLPADSTRAEIFKALGSYAAGASAPAGPASSGFPPESARFAQLMLDIDSVYKAADANSKMGFTGVKAGFAKAGGKGVSMDYTYAVPVAFGVRLYSLSLNTDGTLSDVLPLDGSRPWKLGIVVPLEGSDGVKGEPPASRFAKPPTSGASPSK